MINSPSGIKTFQRCGKLWKYTYIDKKQPLDDSGFEAAYGRAFHGLCEGVPVEHFGPKWTSVLAEHFYAYQKNWEAGPWAVEVVEAELPFKFDLAEGYSFGGIVDAVVVLDGAYYLLETKTTGAKIDEYIEKMEHALQPSLYLLAGKHAEVLTPFHIEGLILDVTRRPGVRQKRGESDTEYVDRVGNWYYDNRDSAFGRAIITKTDDELEDLSGELMMITDLQKTGMHPKNRNECYAFRKQCGFHPVCFDGESLNNEQLYQVRKKR